MPSRPHLPLSRLLLLSCLLFASSSYAADEKPKAPGLGDPGQLTSIQVDTGRTVDGLFTLSGRDAVQQLVVTGLYNSGQTRDLTRSSKYSANPAGIVAIDETGLVTPIAEGETTIEVDAAGQKLQLKSRVTNLVTDLPINFANQITPLFTKYSCNGGGCHGKSGGQNGFRLSLLGFEPKEDYEYLVKEGRGRRIFPAAPDQSLLLLKATARLPHGGGQRVDFDSPAYRLMKRWIEQGMPYGKETDPVVTHIEVFPSERLMDRSTTQQAVVIAHLSDGSTEDVTRTAQFDSNDTEMAEVSVTGLVTTGQLTGSVAIMARYQGHVGVFRATVPLGVKSESNVGKKNFIDELVFKKLGDLGLPSSGVSDDATFLRRVTVDLAGRLPKLEEAEQFLADADPNKRDNVIRRLLESTDYADYFGNKWNAILRNKRRQDFEKNYTFTFHDWIRTSLHENKPYDQFVREILTATGEAGKNAPVAWYREVKDQSAQVEDTAQLFLGLRIQCARCHHHPFEKWSQQDYYGFAAFFAQVGRKRGEVQNEDRIYHRRGIAQASNPKTGQAVKPTGLGSAPLELTADEDPRRALADWMSDPSNPFFARSLVNRYWKHFFGRGLVDPEDDMRVTNPASNPALLDALAKDFVDSKFDLKKLCHTICSSSTYQLTAEPNEWNQDDKQNFSRYYPKRLNAEVLLDAIDQVTGTQSNFGGVPNGTRAVQLPDNGFNSYFLTVFGRPESSSACECERSSEANLAQSLHLLNSGEIQGKLTSGGGRAAKLAADKERPHDVKIRELYLLTFGRAPLPEELAVAVAHIEKNAEDPKRAYEDIVWALINTKEFLFNH
ncbi:protein of unknown function DUF1549 [Pirellula staleyi DSM 6068]|uniref:BIG2 domain-containing protein n=1 Tax=Pirellula staleyi (strain ATCC 27377 / DSM 6068 / ICPB 4128) TaxID=530564 RepID=D2QYN5_PIRSD|nr:DUF1549 domain-containing protein [Pirellula staleyi]ADB18194.1 protein of unknown function DUF1549 [Pirellula staleyi DSM 6068]